MSEQLAFSLEVASKAALYIALLPAIGVCAVRSLLLPRLGVRSGEVGALLKRLGTTTAALVLISLAVRLFTHATAIFGFADAFVINQIRIVALESRWGGGWRVQMLAASALLATSVLIRARPGTSSLLPALAAVVLCYSVPLVGHAAGSVSRVLLHGSHVLAAGSWLGTLTVLLFLAIRLGGRSGSDPVDDGAALRLKLLQGFSPLALSGAAVLLLTGAVSSWLYVGSLSNLRTSSYGWLLVLKIAFVAGVAVCGYVNWRRLSRQNGELVLTGSPGSMTPTIVLEVLLAGVVTLVTATLTEVAHP